MEGARLCSDDMEMAALIDEQAGHLNRLTSELLQMARIDSAEVRLRRERVFVLTLVEDVLARYHEQLASRHVDISTIAPDLEVYGDRGILGAALDQFIDNAARYSTPGSPISVTAGEELGEVVFRHSQRRCADPFRGPRADLRAILSSGGSAASRTRNRTRSVNRKKGRGGSSRSNLGSQR